MIRSPLKKSLKILFGIISIIILILLYALLSYNQHIKNPDDTTIPTVKQFVEGFEKVFLPNQRSGEIWILLDSSTTLSRLLLGLFIGISGSIILGLLMGVFKPVEAFFIPPLSALAKIPPTAALAVFFVMVGTDMEMYIAMIAFGVLPVLAQTVYLAVKDVPDENLNKAATLGASTFEQVFYIIFKQIFPKIINSIRLQLGPALVYLIAAEMMVADVGFGYRIRLQSRLVNMNIVYTYLILLAAFGFLMDYSLKILIRKSCPWYSQSGD